MRKFLSFLLCGVLLLNGSAVSVHAEELDSEAAEETAEPVTENESDTEEPVSAAEAIPSAELDGGNPADVQEVPETVEEELSLPEEGELEISEEPEENGAAEELPPEEESQGSEDPDGEEDLLTLPEETSSPWNLWIGDVQVSPDNASDVLGDKTVQFDAQSSTLTLNNPDLTGKYYMDDEERVVIFCEGMDLTVTGTLNIDDVNAQYGVFHKGNGSLTLRDADITTKTEKDGIAVSGNLIISKSDINAVSVSNDENTSAVTCRSELTLAGGTVNAESGAIGLTADYMNLESGEITAFGTNVSILTKEVNYRLSYTPEIHAGDTKESAVLIDGQPSDFTAWRYVNIRNTQTYGIRIGSTTVTYDNYQDILGDHTASYDPKTGTLNLDHLSLSKADPESGALIFADSADLIIQGTAELKNSEADYGILVKNGSITVSGSRTVLDISAGKSAVSCGNGPVELIDGTVIALPEQGVVTSETGENHIAVSASDNTPAGEVLIAGTAVLTFHANYSGSSETASQTVIIEQETQLDRNPFTREGYTFTGWNTKADGSGKAYANRASAAFHENTDLYAQWNPVTYRITYLLDRGTVAKANPTEYTVETKSFTLNNPVREGSVFLGWTGSNGTEPQKKVTVAKGTTGSLVYYANWAVSVTGVTLSQSAMTLETGSEARLSAAVQPLNAANRNVSWKSSNPKVASVDEYGMVTAAGSGTATITVTTEDGGKTAECKVSVGKSVKPVTGVTLNKTILTLNKGATETLRATVSPSDALNKKVTWTSSNTSAVTVNNSGKVTAAAPGMSIVTVTTDDGSHTAVCFVTVTDRIVVVSSVKLNKTSLTLEEGKTETLNATVSPSNALNKAVVWDSSNSKAASVDRNGTITAHAAGTAVITVTTVDGNRTASCKVTVKKKTPDKDPTACKVFGFCTINGKDYWYENSVRQGTVNDPKGVIGDGTNRGREIYDPETDAWYWLDSCYDGAKAVGKEVWMPYIYQNEKDWNPLELIQIANESDPGMRYSVLDAMFSKKGKWVRYDENGKMLKGWVTIEKELADVYPDQKGYTYYYDNRTGLMAKGYVTLGGKQYHFDETTGVLLTK